MATVWVFNGSTDLSVTIDSTPGQEYSLYIDGGDGATDTETAIGATLVLAVTGLSGFSSGDPFGAFVKKGGADIIAPDADYVAATIFTIGSTAEHSTPDLWAYDGDKTISVTFPTIAGHGYNLPVSDPVNGLYNVATITGDGTVMVLSGALPATPSGRFLAFVYDDTVDSGGDFMDRLFESGAAGVGDPGNPSTLPPSGSTVLLSEPPWRFVVADVVFNGSGTPGFSTLTFLDKRATNRELHYYLRKAAEASGRVLGADTEINIVGVDGEPFVEEGVRILIGLRREGGDPPWVPRFAGPILQATRSVVGDVGYVDFTAYSPRQLLYYRPVREEHGLLLTTQGLTFKAQKGSDILLALLARTNAADGPTFIDFTTGTLEDTDPIDINFQQGSSVGEALDQLEQTGTLDVLLPAVYDPVGSPGILAQLNIHVQAGAIQRGSILAWDLPGRNLDQISWVEDGTQRNNEVELYTADGTPTPVQTDVTSIAKYGSYWGQQNYPVQAELAALEAAAGAQLLVAKGHPETITLGLSPKRAPLVFTEWWLADWMPLYASARLGKKLHGLYRAYEYALTLADDSSATVHDLIVSANKQPA